MPCRKSAFTLVELLVVISIIVILLALLVPGLEKALAASQRSKCGTNLSAIGKANATYLNDSISRTYPKTVGNNGNGWYLLFGKLGDANSGDVNHSTAPNNPSGDSNANGIQDDKDATIHQDVTARPLNHYLGYTSNSAEVKVAQCPSDAGVQFAIANGSDFNWSDKATTIAGAQVDINNCYNQLGSSYITPFKRRTGIDAAFGASPMQASAAKPAASKVMAADAPAYGDNPWDGNRRNRWHSADKTRREMNLLFADGHAEFFEFKNFKSTPDGIETLSKDPNNGSVTGGSQGKPARGYW